LQARTKVCQRHPQPDTRRRRYSGKHLVFVEKCLSKSMDEVRTTREANCSSVLRACVQRQYLRRDGSWELYATVAAVKLIGMCVMGSRDPTLIGSKQSQELE